MGFEEKSIQCIDCHKIFVFTVKAHEFYASIGYPNDPVRCTPCRRARKQHTQYETDAKNTAASRSGKFMR
jgi:hypothetical protein